MEDFFLRTGKMAVGSRLRLLTDRITEDAARIYRMYGVDFKPKWFPVYFVLAHTEPETVTGIARSIGQTHPSVSVIVREMAAEGLVRTAVDRADGRRSSVSLTEKGRQLKGAIDCASKDVAEAVERLAAAAHNDLWAAIGEWEELLAQTPLLRRVEEVRRERVLREVAIVPYEPRYEAAFRALNQAWIAEHWTLEPADCEALEHPQEHILDRGGRIFVALLREKPVGVCALCRSEDPDYDFELAKLAVDPAARGAGIGLRLGEAVIAEARALGGRRMFLESNTRLEAAIGLYRRLGFRRIVDRMPRYERGDILMELELNGN